MTTGTLSGGICFPSQAAAARHECSLYVKAGSVGMHCYGLTGTAPSETDGGAVSVTLVQRWQSAASPSFQTVNYTTALAACEREDYWPWPMTAAEGTLIGGAIVAVWLIAAGVRYVLKALE